MVICHTGGGTMKQSEPGPVHNLIGMTAIGYDNKSDKGSKSVRMRHENSGASKVVEN